MKILYPKAARALAIVAVAVAVGEVLVDWITPLKLNVSIVYTIPLIMAGVARRRRLLWALLVALLSMAFAVYAAKIGPGVFSFSESLFHDRVLSLVTMLLTTALMHLWTRALDALERRDCTLSEQNSRLDAAYRELDGYQQQINRQNKELELRRKEAEAASARKTVLLASMSHDIRTPLNAIGLAAQAIRSATGTAAAARIPAFAQQVLANSLSLENMVSDILDFSTFELGRIELHPSDFALEDLIRQECQILLPLAQSKQLLLVAEPMSEPVHLHADRVKLGRVLTNLVMNAIKYTPAGSVRLAAGRTDEGGVWLRVQDSGIGISAEGLKHIFGEFAQLHATDMERNQGWGLGLSICSGLMALMGGSIGVESSPKHGSAFTVKLPRACVFEPSAARGANGT